MTVDDLAMYLHYSTDELSPDTKRSLENTLKEGKIFIRELLGDESVDFDQDGLPRTLLKNWCRYDLNNATEFFEHNFQKEILRAQLMVSGDQT